MNTNDVNIGDIIVDIGCYPERVGIVVATYDKSFTIKHLQEFLSSHESIPYQSFLYTDDDYIPYGALSSTNSIVMKMVDDYSGRLL